MNILGFTPSKTVYIYALRDPRDNSIVYIGKTVNPRKRYHEHCSDTRKALRSFVAEQIKPQMIVLAKCAAPEAAELEQLHIAQAMREGHVLLNKHALAPGGNSRERERFSRRKKRLIARLRRWKPTEREDLLRSLLKLWPVES